MKKLVILLINAIALMMIILLHFNEVEGEDKILCAGYLMIAASIDFYLWFRPLIK